MKPQSPHLHRLRGWLRPLGWIALSVVALSLFFAPLSQCYLAWIGLVPFFLMVHERPSQRAAMLWGWIAGILFFFANMWWLLFVTVPGTFALVVYLGVFWGLAAVFIRGLGLVRPDAPPLPSILLLAAGWTAMEWLRGSYSPFGHHGLPWLFLGYTQTPILAGCQIADITGVYGVTFWVVLVNALLTRVWLQRDSLRSLRPAIATVAGIVAAIMCYGVYRIMQTHVEPGPTVLVVQPNYPQSNTGEKGAEMDEIVRFHVTTTDNALKECEARGTKVDLVVWSETMMPSLNRASREFMRGVTIDMAGRRYDYGQFIEDTSQQISDLADRYRTNLLVGGVYSDQWAWKRQADGREIPLAGDHRNSTFFYEPTGLLSALRYDKIQLLPFGEYVPFKNEIPPLYHLLVSLGPPDMEYYELTAGAPDALTVFPLETYASRAATTQSAARYRFVTPICFEDIVAPLVRDLFNGPGGSKRADFIVNVTNDGWFKANERTQHMQAAVFRSIEHRVPTARSVNTGMSGFVDSVGRVSDCVAPGTEGWAVHTLAIDNRVALYTRWGDWFVVSCAVAAGALAIASIMRKKLTIN